MSSGDTEKQVDSRSPVSSIDPGAVVTHGLDSDEQITRRLWWKVDLHIMPVAVLLYLASYIDRLYSWGSC